MSDNKLLVDVPARTQRREKIKYRTEILEIIWTLIE